LVIAAIAALINNAQTITKAAVSAYQWVKGEEHGNIGTGTSGNSKHVLERIRRGQQFHITLSKSFHDLQAGETYVAWYSPTLRQMFVTGFAASSKQPNVTNKYPCPNIDSGHINLWGHPFSIEDGEIVDSSEGRSGKIYFDDEGQ
jgi:hypothetical protein